MGIRTGAAALAVVLAAGPSGAKALDDEALTMPDGRFSEIWGSFAVASFYADFHEMSDDEVRVIVDRARHRVSGDRGPTPR